MEREELVSGDDIARGPRARAMSAPMFGLQPDAEGDVIGHEQWKAIHERRAAGKTVSAIAREFDVDRKTVRSCLRRATWTPYRRETGIATVLDAHRAWIVERHPGQLLGAHPTPGTAQPAGLRGQLRNRQARGSPVARKASLAGLTQRRFETGPGRQAQIDWGQVTVSFGGQRSKVHIFVMTLGYSRRGYAEGFTSERIPDLLAAHERAFAYFGGRCEFLLYDRMRTVVLGTTTDEHGERKAKFNATFAAFADHWGFTPRLCRPTGPRPRAKVESGVKYVKRNFVPGRSFADLDDFNRQLALWQVEIADLRITARPTSDRSTALPTEWPHWCPRPARPASCKPWSLAGRRRRLAGVDRRQPLLGTFRSDRPVRRGRACRRPLADLPSRATGRQHPVLAGRAQLSVCPGTVPAPPRWRPATLLGRYRRGTASRRSGSA